MRSTLVSSILILLGVSIASGQSDNDQADRDALQALIKQVESANNSGDVDTWVSLFASDFVYMPSNVPPVTERNELMAMATTGFRNKAAVSINPIEIQVFKDWAFARSHVTGTVTLHGSGKVINVDLKQLVIYSRNKEGQWRIARLMINSNS